ncbi:unnamed protein product, partial [Discosporangium mesarthrocarpum]
LVLRFQYLPALNIIAVYLPATPSPSPSVGGRGGTGNGNSNSGTTSAAAATTTAPRQILTNLFPGDTGELTPNPVNHHGPAALMSPRGVFEYPQDVAPRPFRWAQWLAGLYFPPGLGSRGMGAGAGAGVGAGVRVGQQPLEPSTRAVVSEVRSR